MGNAFVVDDPIELLALQQVFQEAKFSSDAVDADIAHSPVVSRLFERLVATLMSNDIDRGGDGAQARWAQWLLLDETRAEWAVAVRRASANAQWAALSPHQRAEYVQVLLSPFTLPPEGIDRFLRVVGHANQARFPS
jgi:hypothetical protein